MVEGIGEWSCVNNFVQNVITSGIDNSSSIHADKHKINFLVLR